ncbi:MAG: hypothetical protein NTY77_10245 [Elusimicrobia bacterium]|nr:hypothetical protein [Elusimicrobiota bacterium]
MLSPRLLVLAAAASFGACVSLEDAPMVKGAMAQGQSTVVFVFAAPGPVMSERSSNLEQAAKVVPGLGILMKASQDKRDFDASQDLQRFLPAWQPAQLFAPGLMQALAGSGLPGRLLTPAEAGVPDAALSELNRAQDISDWQLRYYVRGVDPEPAPRGYRGLASLRDALVLEANLAYGAPSDGEGRWMPELSAVMKLYRASDMTLLWRHEDVVDDKAGKRTSGGFKKEPGDLVAKWQALMPALAQAMAASLRQNLQGAGAFVPAEAK